jgi:N-acetylglutamate synthase/N-acetylornithine aminotransferase
LLNLLEKVYLFKSISVMGDSVLNTHRFGVLGRRIAINKSSNAVTKAILQTLRKFWITLVTTDRFTKGHLAAMFESGHITIDLEADG